MKKAVQLLFVFIAILLGSWQILTVKAENASDKIFFGKEIKTEIASKLLQQQFTKHHLYEVDVKKLHSFVNNPNYADEIQLILDDEYNWNIKLFAYDLRGEHFTARIATENGEQVLPSTPNITYRGYVQDSGGGEVRLTITENFLGGMIEVAGEEFFIESLQDFDESAKQQHFVVYKSSDVIPLKGRTCGAMAAHRHTENTIHQQQKSNSEGEDDKQAGVAVCQEVDVTFAIDYALVVRRGGVDNANVYVMNLLNLVDGMYVTSRGFTDDINFLVQELYTSTCATCDPWTASTDASTILTDFTNWGASGFNAPRDVGQLVSGRDFDGSTLGVAYIDGACSNLRYSTIEVQYNNNTFIRNISGHEFGHSLGGVRSSTSGHDNPNDGVTTVMDPFASTTNTWSATSINDIETNVANEACISNGCSTSICNNSVVEGLDIVSLTGASLDLAWDNSPFTSNYRIRFRLVNTNSWTVVANPTTNFATLPGLSCGDAYEIQVQNACGSNSYGPPATLVIEVGGASDVTVDAFSASSVNVCDGDLINFDVDITPGAGFVEGVDYTVNWSGPSGSFTTSGAQSFPINYADTPGDAIAPTLVLGGGGTSTPLFWPCGVAFIEPGFLATDNLEGTISNRVIVDYSNLCLDQAGTYTINYSVEDSDGNTTTATRTLFVPSSCSSNPCPPAISPGGNLCERIHNYDLEVRCANGAFIDQRNIEILVYPPINATTFGAGTNFVYIVPDCGAWPVTWDDGQGNTGTGKTYDSNDYGSYDGIVTFTIQTNAPASCGPTIYTVPFLGIGPIPNIRAEIKVVLEGAYNNFNGLMNTNLQNGVNVLPTNQPFNTAPWNHAGTESVANQAAIPPNTVDWILAEFRLATTGTLVVRKAGFLLHDGTVVETDGTTGLLLNVVPTNYNITIRHRNHLDIVSNNSVALPNAGTPADFTNPLNIKLGTKQTKVVMGGFPPKVAMLAGDTDANGIINIEDFNLYRDQLAPPNIDVYQNGDCNLDGNLNVPDFNKYQPNSSIIGIPEIRY